MVRTLRVFLVAIGFFIILVIAEGCSSNESLSLENTTVDLTNPEEFK